MFEGWAKDLEEAEAKAAAGAFRFEPNHHYGAVGPMTGMTTVSQPVLVVENRAFGNRAYCAINEGLGKVMRFGGNDAEVLARLAWLRDVLGPALGRALREIGGIPLEAHHRARAHHGRRDAPAQRRLLEPAPARCWRRRWRERRGTPRRWHVVSISSAKNDQFFLNIAMAMGKAITDPARDIEGSSVVTAMSPQRHRLRHPRVAAPAIPGSRRQLRCRSGSISRATRQRDANPDMGDSAIVETVGLGGFAMAAAPAVVGFVGAGPASGAVTFTRAMGEITVGQQS